MPASDIHGLLLGVETNIRDIAFRFCNFIGNEANSMQFPGIARFGKTPNEVFPLSKIINRIFIFFVVVCDECFNFKI